MVLHDLRYAMGANAADYLASLPGLTLVIEVKWARAARLGRLLHARRQVRRCHDRFRWFGLGWPVNSELTDPRAFSSASASVTKDDVAQRRASPASRSSSSEPRMYPAGCLLRGDGAVDGSPLRPAPGRVGDGHGYPQE